MYHAVLSRGIVSLMLIAGMTSAIRAEGTMYQPDQHIMVRTGSKGERRCVIISATKRPDGVVEYRVKAIDNGEVMTIVDRASSAVARSKPVESETPKVSVSSDPLLASSLRQPAPATAQTPDFAVPPDAIATKPQPHVTPRPRVINDPAPVVVTRDPRSRPTGIDSTSGIATLGADPVPLQQVRYTRETVTTTAADPVSMGFMIPVANPRQTPVNRQFEREDRIVTLGETLKNALQPSARLNAAESLAEGVGSDSAAVRSLLMTAAANDPAAVVRAACIRCLVKIGVRDVPFQALMLTAKQDSDARVRIEVDRAEEMGR